MLPYIPMLIRPFGLFALDVYPNAFTSASGLFPLEAVAEIAWIYRGSHACFYQIAHRLIACFWYIIPLDTHTHTHTHTLQFRCTDTFFSDKNSYIFQNSSGTPSSSVFSRSAWPCSVPEFGSGGFAFLSSLFFSWFIFCHWSCIKGGSIICSKFSKALNKFSNQQK